MSWESVFGPSLVTKSGSGTASVSTEAHLAGKFVLIYFSAHWCPPCRGFTPELVTFYNNLKSKRSDFELVFVSSDQNDSQFNEYYGEMPWAALPFADRDRKNILSAKFGVRGIPTLVVLGTTGELITTKAREKVSEDPTGAEFPWVPQTLQEELGTSFIGKNGPVTNSSFAGKFIGIYFSAHWCPPCRGFTPKLVEYYNTRKTQGKDDFEIIFASSDHDQASFDEYYGEMPWLALPHGDSRINKLSSRFEVEGIPSFVIIDPEGNVVNTNARGCIMADPMGQNFPYYPEPAEDLSESLESFGADINSVPSLVVFMENADDSDQADAKTALCLFGETMAKAKAGTPEGPEMIFFYAFKPSPMASRIRELCHLPSVQQSESPVMVIINIQDGKTFYQSDVNDVNANTIGAFIDAFKAGTLQRKTLG